MSNAAIRYVQSDVSPHSKRAIGHLVELLCLLLPKAPKGSIEQASKDFIREAIALKNALAEERAVYQFFWVASGEIIQRDYVETGEGGAGVVGICTFPGLVRKVKEDDIVTINVVKANVKSWASLSQSKWH